MGEPAINIIGYDNCTGCFGCYNACHLNAIEMKYDEEGFYKPYILSSCVDCGQCEKACPVIEIENNNKCEKAYAAWSNDNKILLNSSSGGIFSELAIEILNENGVVYGVSWENGEVKHKRIEKIEDLKELRGSKYLPSFVGNSYKNVINDLKNNKKVLFSGTPCQIAALNKIVKNDKLITVDLICHGMPSHKAYEKYCKENFNEKVEKVNFRDKGTGWTNFSLIYYSNILKNNLHYVDKFFFGFLKNIYLGNPCYDCKFKGTKEGEKRQADITLADFWGVPKELYNKNGVSFIVTNNKKGEEYFDRIKNKIFFKEISLEMGLKSNSSFYKSCTKPKERELFYKDFDDYTFDELSNKYFKTDSLLEIKIKGIISFPIRVLRFIKRKIVKGA